MIDAETHAALETHLAVQLAVLPRARFRELAQAHGADAARKAVARDLAARLAAAFDITPRADRPAAPSTRHVMRPKDEP